MYLNVNILNSKLNPTENIMNYSHLDQTMTKVSGLNRYSLWYWQLKKIAVSFLIPFTIACSTPKTTIMKPKETLSLEYETFDFEKYKDLFDRYNAINYKYQKEDGTVVYIVSAGKMSGNGDIFINEIPPLPYFISFYKEFYPNGNLKEKGQHGMQSCPIGKWLECDEEGNCKIVDYDENRRFTYEDVLRFMAKQKHIDLKTGEGREQMSTIYNYEQQVWSVGTSRGYLIGRDYILDGNTGKILKDEIAPFVP